LTGAGDYGTSEEYSKPFSTRRQIIVASLRKREVLRISKEREEGMVL
jgi:hypothetical protein